MDKAKLASGVIKIALSLIVSAGIGYAIKAQKIADSKIEEYFAPENIEFQEIVIES